MRLLRRSSLRGAPLALAALGAWLLPRLALAQAADPQQAALAQTLYDQAIPAMRAGDFATACPKLEQVVELAPGGIGAKIMLAECYEGLGRLASAWMTFAAVEAAAATANQIERQKKARDHGRALKPRLAMLTVMVPDAVRATPGLEIRRDGLLVKPLEWGLALPADKGKHVLVAAAPGRRRWEKTVEISDDGVQASVTVEALAEQAGAPASPPPSSSPPSPPSPEVPSTWNGRRTAGVVVTVVGLAGVGVGSFFGFTAISKKNQSNDGHCHPDNRCDPMGIALRDDGFRAATAATTLFIVGGAALVGGVTLVAIPPSAPGRAGAKVALGPGGIDLRGAW